MTLEAFMYKQTCLSLLLAVGTAAAASVEPVNPEPQLRTNQRLVPSDNIGYIYYQPATGEMVRIDPGEVGGSHTRGTSDPVWVNEITDQCGFGESFYSPIRDSATGEDTWWMDLGDISENACIDTITIFYATDLPDPEEDGEDGFEMDLTFFDGLDIGQINCNTVPYLTFVLAGIPGSASGVAGWMITIDLTDFGDIEIGDTDGVDTCGSGNNSGGQGSDVDGDGNADFGYGFNFRHPASATTGATGCMLVVPPGGSLNTIGDDDWMALFFSQDWSNPDGLYWFGGYDCAGGPGDWNPWASYYIGLYGSGGACPPDRNNDGVLDFFDIQDFLIDFAAEDPSADFNNDGLFDFFDVQVYLGAFVVGCG
jgi:hypothetical protein